MSQDKFEVSHEFNLPTEETFRISMNVYDPRSGTSTYHPNVGVFTRPIDPLRFSSPPTARPTAVLVMEDEVGVVRGYPLGNFNMPIDFAQYKPVDPTSHLPMVDCDCAECHHYWCNEPDPHPPMRDCGCLLQCKPYFDAKDGTPSDGAMYAAIPSAPWNETNAQKALIMALHGTVSQQEEARKFFLYHLSRNRKR